MALAIGESESGKSYLMRRVGQLLYGESFNVIPVKAGEKGEEDYWTTVTTRSFAAFDNVDKPIRWLEDALATASTGTQISKRRLHTTNEEAVYEARAFLSLTARTPRFRREDVASRILILHLDRLLEKKAEGDLQREVMAQRDLLLSEYVHILNRVVAQPPVPSLDPTFRMQDFAALASRIGTALGKADLTRAVLQKSKRSQHIYATEEDPLYDLLLEWVARTSPRRSDLDAIVSNNGRRTPTGDLFNEIRALAETLGARFNYANPKALGKRLQGLEEALGETFTVEHGRTKAGKWWSFELREDTDDNGLV
ncbi:MAG: hypothetical protein HYX97_02930 [Chloroflexi bacterium]|nr:hypothetical protein [Chloroflexota bacterium]